MAPKISILIPCYNHEKYVGDAIKSALEPSLENFELIIADDCSNDNSFAVCSSFKNKNVFLFKNIANQGAPSTINALLGKATGDFIAILNSDDLFHPDRIKKIVTHMEEAQLDLCGSRITPIDKQGNPISDETHWWNVWYNGLINNVRSENDIRRSLLRGNFFITTSNFVFRRKVFDTLSGFSEFRYVHDYEYLLRMLFGQQHCRIGYLDEVLLSYRIHDSNTISENPIQANEETLELLHSVILHGKLDESMLNIALAHARQLFTNVKHMYLHANFLKDEANKNEKAREKSLREHAETLAEISLSLESCNVKTAEKDGQIKKLQEEVFTIKSSNAYKTGLKMAVIWRNFKKLYTRA